VQSTSDKKNHEKDMDQISSSSRKIAIP
jgi:hypothetical protein